ncbi:MAG: hypothetical protein ACRDFB_08410 [Rhabdochlamydiaceae bacterium]
MTLKIEVTPVTPVTPNADPLPNPNPAITDKVKYLFTVSDWLYIGSVLVSFSSVGVLLLAKKTSFIKPFSMYVTSIVLGLLGMIYEGRMINVAPIVDKVKSLIPKSSLREGSSFTFEGQNYYIAPTQADGACGAHAVLGTKQTMGSMNYAYCGDNVRASYVNKLSERKKENAIQLKWEEWMIHFVKDYLNCEWDWYAGLVFSRIPMQDLKGKLLDLDRQKNDLQSAQKLLFQKALAEEDSKQTIMIVLQREIQKQEQRTQTCLQSQLELDDEFKYGKIQESLSEIIELLKDKEIGVSISENFDQQIKIDNDRTECYRNFIKEDAVFTAYTQGIACPTYYFSTQELGLMAFLFDLHVRVLHEKDGVLTMELDEGDLTNPNVVVFHKGCHFSRCELCGSVTSAQ